MVLKKYRLVFFSDRYKRFTYGGRGQCPASNDDRNRWRFDRSSSLRNVIGHCWMQLFETHAVSPWRRLPVDYCKNSMLNKLDVRTSIPIFQHEITRFGKILFIWWHWRIFECFQVKLTGQTSLKMFLVFVQSHTNLQLYFFSDSYRLVIDT